MSRRTLRLSRHTAVAHLALIALAISVAGCMPDTLGPDPATRNRLPTAHATLTGTTLFSQGPRLASEGDALRSNLDVGPGSSETPQQVADGFTLPSRAQLQRVSWEGTYFRTPLPSIPTVAFNIRIHTNLAHTPLFEALVNASYTEVGMSEFGSPIYRFSADVPGPVLETGVPYRIAIVESDTSTSVDFRWWKTGNQAAGDYAIHSDPGSAWFIQSSDMYHDFVLELEGVTPPSDLLFLQGPATFDLSNALRSNLLVGSGTAEMEQQVADDFQLGVAAPVGRITWDGYYWEMPLTVSSVAFRIRIYTSLTAAPLLDAAVNATVQQIGTAWGQPIYRFSVNLGSGIALQANQVYWLAVLESDPSTPIDFRWMETDVFTRHWDWQQMDNRGGSAFAHRSSPAEPWFTQTWNYRHGFAFSLHRASPPAPGSTPAGTNVSVLAVDPTTGARVQMTFDNVTTSGQTTVTPGNVGQGGSPPAPDGFKLGDPPIYYDVQTTATFTGRILLCFAYPNTGIGNESLLKLLHYENGAWRDVTASLDTANNIICGAVTSLSPFLVAEENAAPVLNAISLPAAPVSIGTNVTVTAAFTDANTGDNHSASVTWDDGSISAGTVTESEGAGTIGASHIYSAPGVYTLSVKVNDGDADGVRSSTDDQPAYVVVYDPSAGFVTGGGWFDSPAGACRWSGCATDGSTSGKASFGFVSRYQKGATTPSGSTEFQFKAGGLSFRSVSYDWLVVAGSRAQYKGQGEIAGASGSYGFMLTAIDGSANGADRFRIKIWDIGSGAIVYDNQIDQPDDSDAATAIGGGSIVIHR